MSHYSVLLEFMYITFFISLAFTLLYFYITHIQCGPSTCRCSSHPMDKVSSSCRYSFHLMDKIISSCGCLHPMDKLTSSCGCLHPMDKLSSLCGYLYPMDNTHEHNQYALLYSYFISLLLRLIHLLVREIDTFASERLILLLMRDRYNDSHNFIWSFGSIINEWETCK